MQYNALTGKAYNGVNLQTLIEISETFKLPCGWLTFLQATELGLKIKKGSKAVKIIKVIEDEKTKAVRFYNLFNIKDTQAN